MADLDPELLRLATGQHGMLTTRQARAVGVGPFVLERLVDEDALWHPCRGLYGVAALVDDTPQARHRALSAGAHLIYGDAVLTGSAPSSPTACRSGVWAWTGSRSTGRSTAASG